MNDEGLETRQERREQKLESKRARIRKHGRSLARVYKEVILKRINKLRAYKDRDRGQGK
ncbi:hypothetical protein ACFLWC_00915 [Chloroflexota bacterium]